jgi:hypothetical protein
MTVTTAELNDRAQAILMDELIEEICLCQGYGAVRPGAAGATISISPLPVCRGASELKSLAGYRDRPDPHDRAH